MTARRPPALERLAPGFYQVQQGEATGWLIEYMPSPRPMGAWLGLPWVVYSDRGVVSEHCTLADARGSMPQVLR